MGAAVQAGARSVCYTVCTFNLLAGVVQLAVAATDAARQNFQPVRSLLRCYIVSVMIEDRQSHNSPVMKYITASTGDLLWSSSITITVVAVLR
jgi:hypothetical protein